MAKPGGLLGLGAFILYLSPPLKSVESFIPYAPQSCFDSAACSRDSPVRAASCTRQHKRKSLIRTGCRSPVTVDSSRQEEESWGRLPMDSQMARDEVSGADLAPCEQGLTSASEGKRSKSEPDMTGQEGINSNRTLHYFLLSGSCFSGKNVLTSSNM